jgi:hypothetical protein
MVEECDKGGTANRISDRRGDEKTYKIVGPTGMPGNNRERSLDRTSNDVRQTGQCATEVSSKITNSRAERALGSNQTISAISQPANMALSVL